MKATFLTLLFPAILFAADANESERPDKRLVEVSYAFYAQSARPLPVRVTLYLSERWRGSITDIPYWARQGGAVGEEHTQAKAEKCLALLKRLTEPNDLPEESTQIVSVRCADGDKWVTRRFRIDRLPNEVRQILLTMGFSEGRFRFLTFTEK